MNAKIPFKINYTVLVLHKIILLYNIVNDSSSEVQLYIINIYFSFPTYILNTILVFEDILRIALSVRLYLYSLHLMQEKTPTNTTLHNACVDFGGPKR